MSEASDPVASHERDKNTMRRNFRQLRWWREPARRVKAKAKAKGCSLRLAFLMKPVRGLRGICYSNRFPLLLLACLLLINVTCIVAYVWQRRRSIQSTVAVVRPQVASYPLRAKDELFDPRWTTLLVQPFRALFIVVGVVPVLLIVGVFCRNPNQHRSTILAYGFVCILMWVTLFTVNHVTDDIASTVLTDKAYMQFQKRFDTRLGMEIYTFIPATIGVGLFVTALTMKRNRRSRRAGIGGRIQFR
jgi:hypothetical protein